jgi:hypothetical protein
MRIVRAVIGTLLLLVAVPTLVAGAVLWQAMQHRDADGSFRARIEPVTTDGYAVVIEDVDALLRRDAAFARGGRTTLRVSAPGRFVGIGPRADVDRYLAGVRRMSIERVRLARGALPVDARPLDADAASANSTGSASVGPGPATAAPPGTPQEQPFWRYTNAGAVNAPVTWSPSSVRGQRLALVVMNPDASARVSAALVAAVTPQWLNPMTWGLLILGTVALLLGTLSLAWPQARREVVYVVTPDQMPEVTAYLGLAPSARAGATRYVGSTGYAGATTPDGSAPSAQSRPPTEPAIHAGELPRPPVSVRLTWPPAAAAAATPAPVPVREGPSATRLPEPAEPLGPAVDADLEESHRIVDPDGAAAPIPTAVGGRCTL